MQKINVVLMRGLMGNVYSRGMDVLGAKLAKLEGVDYVSVEDYTNWRSTRDRIARWKDPTVLGPAHSFGGNAVTIIAESLPEIQFPLLLTVDPSPYWSWSLWQSGPSRIGKNVSRAVNLYQTSGLIGRVLLTGAAWKIVNTPISSSHTDIDDDARVHSEAIAEVRSLIARLNTPQPKAA